MLILPAAASRNVAANLRSYHLLALIFGVFSGVVGLTSFRLLQTQAAAQSATPGLGMPTWVPQASITVGCVLIFVTQCIILLNTILHHKKKEGEAA